MKLSLADARLMLKLPEDVNDLETIKRAYKVAALKWHPDKHANASEDEQHEIQEKMKRVNAAYQRVCKGEEASDSETEFDASFDDWEDMDSFMAAMAEIFTQRRRYSSASFRRRGPRGLPSYFAGGTGFCFGPGLDSSYPHRFHGKGHQSECGVGGWDCGRKCANHVETASDIKQQEEAAEQARRLFEHEAKQAAILKERKRRSAAECFVTQLPRPKIESITETSVQVCADPKNKFHGGLPEGALWRVVYKSEPHGSWIVTPSCRHNSRMTIADLSPGTLYIFKACGGYLPDNQRALASESDIIWYCDSAATPSTRTLGQAAPSARASPTPAKQPLQRKGRATALRTVAEDSQAKRHTEKKVKVQHTQQAAGLAVHEAEKEATTKMAQAAADQIKLEQEAKEYEELLHAYASTDHPCSSGTSAARKGRRRKKKGVCGMGGKGLPRLSREAQISTEARPLVPPTLLEHEIGSSDRASEEASQLFRCASATAADAASGTCAAPLDVEDEHERMLQQRAAVIAAEEEAEYECALVRSMNDVELDDVAKVALANTADGAALLAEQERLMAEIAAARALDCKQYGGGTVSEREASEWALLKQPEAAEHGAVYAAADTSMGEQKQRAQEPVPSVQGISAPELEAVPGYVMSMAAAAAAMPAQGSIQADLAAMQLPVDSRPLRGRRAGQAEPIRKRAILPPFIRQPFVANLSGFGAGNEAGQTEGHLAPRTEAQQTCKAATEQSPESEQSQRSSESAFDTRQLPEKPATEVAEATGPLGASSEQAAPPRAPVVRAPSMRGPIAHAYQACEPSVEPMEAAPGVSQQPPQASIAAIPSSASKSASAHRTAGAAKAVQAPPVPFHSQAGSSVGMPPLPQAPPQQASEGTSVPRAGNLRFMQGQQRGYSNCMQAISMPMPMPLGGGGIHHAYANTVNMTMPMYGVAHYMAPYAPTSLPMDCSPAGLQIPPPVSQASTGQAAARVPETPGACAQRQAPSAQAASQGPQWQNLAPLYKAGSMQMNNFYHFTDGINWQLHGVSMQDFAGMWQHEHQWRRQDLPPPQHRWQQQRCPQPWAVPPMPPAHVYSHM